MIACKNTKLEIRELQSTSFELLKLTVENPHQRIQTVTDFKTKE